MKLFNVLRILVLAITFALLGLGLGCAKKEEKPMQEVKQTDGKIGPYEVQFSGTSKTFSNVVDIPINQPEGKLEFFITDAKESRVFLTESKTLVGGCDANQIRYEVIWFPDQQNLQQYYYVTKGSSFVTRANTKGLLLASFRNITGCTNLRHEIQLRKEEIALPEVATGWRDAKSALCVHTNGKTFSVSFPNLRMGMDSYGFPTYNFGDVCYTTGTEKTVYPTSLQAVYVLGSRTVLQLFGMSSGPTAFVETIDGARGGGSQGKWYNYNQPGNQSDMTCTMYKAPLSDCK